MSRRQQACRNFLSGHCRFGANCRFSHASQNQSSNTAATNPFGFGSQKQTSQQQQDQQKTNPFGFGTQRQTFQEKPNPFGFGVQNINSPLKTNPTNAFAKQPETQATVHTCSDPEACKKIIIEDSKNEAPLWKLTCYGHAKNGACDLGGDISCEELRALAYEESKQGRTLQSIVERERNLLQSKLAEFDNLIRNPFVSKNNTSSFALTGFSQLGAANNPTTSPSPFSQSNSLNISAEAQPQNKFGFGMANNSAFGNGIQQPNTTNVSNFTFGRPALNANQQQPSFLPSTSNNSNNTSKQQSMSLGFGFLLPTSPPPSNLNAQPPLNKQEDAIWLKEKWSIGEIPEQAPPLQYC